MVISGAHHLTALGEADPTLPVHLGQLFITRVLSLRISGYEARQLFSTQAGALDTKAQRGVAGVTPTMGESAGTFPESLGDGSLYCLSWSQASELTIPSSQGYRHCFQRQSQAIVKALVVKSSGSYPGLCGNVWDIWGYSVYKHQWQSAREPGQLLQE